MKLHERSHIGKAHVVRARGDALNGGARARACIQAHIQFRIFEIAFGNRRQKQSSRAFKAPVELEFDRRVGLCEGVASKHANGGQRAEAQGFQRRTFVHRNSGK